MRSRLRGNSGQGQATFPEHPFGTGPRADRETYLRLHSRARAVSFPAIDAFEQSTGHAIDIDWMEELAVANSYITQADAAAFHRERLQEHPDWFGEDVWQRLEFGRALTSTQYSLAMRSRLEGKRKIENLFTKYDLLMLPTTPVTAPLMEGTDGVNAAKLLTRFTSPFNLAGIPALSLPCGFSEAGMPVGLQLVARAWDETRLLQAGYAYEKNTGWEKYHPPV